MNMVTKDLQDLVGIHFPEAHSDSKKMADLADAAFEKEIFENIGVPFCMTVEAEAMGSEVILGDEILEPRVVKYKFEDIKDWNTARELDVTSGRVKVVLDAIKLIKEKNLDAPIVGNLSGPISVASSVMEPNAFYKSLIKHKKEAHSFIEFTTKQL